MARDRCCSRDHTMTTTCDDKMPCNRHCTRCYPSHHSGCPTIEWILVFHTCAHVLQAVMFPELPQHPKTSVLLVLVTVVELRPTPHFVPSPLSISTSPSPFFCGIPFTTSTFPAHAQPVPQVMRTACTPSSTYFSGPVSGEERALKRTDRRFVSLRISMLYLLS